MTPGTESKKDKTEAADLLIWLFLMMKEVFL
jgi:hypothetical protein